MASRRERYETDLVEPLDDELLREVGSGRGMSAWSERERRHDHLMWEAAVDGLRERYEVLRGVTIVLAVTGGVLTALGAALAWAHPHSDRYLSLLVAAFGCLVAGTVLLKRAAAWYVDQVRGRVQAGHTGRILARRVWLRQSGVLDEPQ